MTVVNRDPGATVTDASLVMAVGVPGEDIGTVADAGAVQVFGPCSAPGVADRWVEAGNGAGMPGTPTAAQNRGTSLYGTRANLSIGMPCGPGAHGSLRTMPWANATGGTVRPHLCTGHGRPPGCGAALRHVRSMSGGSTGGAAARPPSCTGTGRRRSGDRAEFLMRIPNTAPTLGNGH
ncbi:hypothetical protein [Streptomyces sp. NPDC008092]|uniref:hypothetical protein n=1 Tax=Streptomyces sp. NPDC008092 TaxID=3364808 RepID=UPI0036E0C125